MCCTKCTTHREQHKFLHSCFYFDSQSTIPSHLIVFIFGIILIFCSTWFKDWESHGELHINIASCCGLAHIIAGCSKWMCASKLNFSMIFGITRVSYTCISNQVFALPSDSFFVHSKLFQLHGQNQICRRQVF